MKLFKIFLLPVVVLSLLAGCATQGPWRGKVIDSETKQPIEGAAVVAVWHTVNMGLGDTVDRFYDAKETVTDKDGNWEIPQYKIFFVRNQILPPLPRGLKMPEFTIFKPGYGHFPKYQVKPKGVSGWEEFSKENAVVELPKLKSDKERRDMLLYSLGSSLVGRDKAPNFYKLYNEESKYLGLGEL